MRRPDPASVMQHGDLETWTSHRIVVVLEGVLATVTPIESKRWGQRAKLVGWDFAWHDVPLKRLVYMKGRWPEMAFDIVTFLDADAADFAADYLSSIPIPYDTIESVLFKAFCDKLRFRTDIQQIIDSDPERLQRYGQLGKQVTVGGDW